jgi:hypothetical protein
MAMLRAGATYGDMDGVAKTMNPDAPPVDPDNGYLTRESIYRAQTRKPKPLTPTQVAANAKAARKNLVRLVQGSASGEQIMTAWRELLKWDPAFDVERLPVAVANTVVLFKTFEDSVVRPIVAAWSEAQP